MIEETPPLPAQSFRDRRVGLIVFGILTILLGGLFLLFVPLMILGQAMAPAAAGGAAGPQNLGFAAGMYGFLAVLLIWLGIGSLLARRWARALLLILSWSGLLVGLATVTVMAVTLPQMTEIIQATQPAGGPQLSPGSMRALLLVPMLFAGGFMILVPGAGVIFYGSRNVKATCEARDPVTRWTDACPLPVLAASLWLAFSALMVLFLPLSLPSVLPVFGTFLTGAPATIGYFVFAALWAGLAWSLYRLKRWGWWLTLLILGVFTLSNVLTYSRHDVSELYQLMGYPPAQIEQMRKIAFFGSKGMMWAMALVFLPLLGYLIFIRKFFRRTN